VRAGHEGNLPAGGLVTAPRHTVTLLCYFGAVAAALVSGAADLRNVDIQATVVLVGGSAFALSYLRPRQAWPIALIVGAGVPLAHWYARRAGIRLPYVVGSPVSTLLSFVPAAVGASTALGLRRFIAGHRGEDEDP
jgi:hypothetical protein